MTKLLLSLVVVQEPMGGERVKTQKCAVEEDEDEHEVVNRRCFAVCVCAISCDEREWW